MTEATEIAPAPGEVHVWSADLDAGEWPDAEELPAAERARAAAIAPAPRRRRWVASRWALREVLGRRLDVGAAAVALRSGRRGKPALIGGSSLRFSLSHSGGLALIAVAADREVGIDVERRGRRPAPFYEDWTRREAAAKCFGGGLGEPLPDCPMHVVALDLGEEWAGALAVAGTDEPLVRRFDLAPRVARGRR